jgi:tetratricopeptide (TPR) repeat protein
MATAILAISEPAAGAERDPVVVHARAVCALTAVNGTWDIAAFRGPLADVEAMLARGPGAGDGPGERPPHPMAVVGAVLVAYYDERDPDRALRLLAAQFGSADPWTGSAARLMHGVFLMGVGRLDGVAGQLAEALAGFQAVGDRWGMGLALTIQAELGALDGDHAGVIASLERAVELSRELTNREDTAQIYASLAKSRSRLGDYRGALADMARAEQAAREQGEPLGDLWITYIRAELEWLRGDIAEAGRISRALDARMASKDTAMISPFRAQTQNRAALADIRSGNVAAGLAGLAAALRLARGSLDRSVVAAVVDGVAAAGLWTDGSRASAGRAAVLLGAAHSIRGAFDHSSLDAPEARDRARHTLGGEAFAAAYQRGRELGYEDALALAEDTVSEPEGRGAP